jgi:hypothetical protein
MSQNAKYCKPTEEKMTSLVKDWWHNLDVNFRMGNGKVPEESILSSIDQNYAYLYGHYDRKGNAAGSNSGCIKSEHRDLTILAPLINGRYGTGPYAQSTVESIRDGTEGIIARSEGVTTGIILSQYVTDTYAKISRGGKVAIIPQVHWISHEYPRSHDLVDSEFQLRSSADISNGFYYGIWFCLEGQQLEIGDVLEFGGKGGPHVAALPVSAKDDTINPDIKKWLPRFETHATWTVLETCPQPKTNSS